MSSRDEVTLTIEQCQRLVETSALARNTFPKKWGEKPVPDHEQLTGREDVSDLYKVLRAYSPWMQEIGSDYRLIFGAREDWYPADADGKQLVDVKPDDPRIGSWKFKDQLKTYKIRLSHEAMSGIVWCCIIRLHPQTNIPLSTRDPIESWWLLSEAVGKTTAVRKYIGLASARRSEWECDHDEPPKDLQK